MSAPEPAIKTIIVAFLELLVDPDLPRRCQDAFVDRLYDAAFEDLSLDHVSEVTNLTAAMARKWPDGPMLRQGHRELKFAVVWRYVNVHSDRQHMFDFEARLGFIRFRYCM